MLLINNKDRKLFDILKECFRNCKECKIAVAYVRNSGINPIIGDIDTVLKNGGRIKLLSSIQIRHSTLKLIYSMVQINVSILLDHQIFPKVHYLMA